MADFPDEAQGDAGGWEVQGGGTVVGEGVEVGVGGGVGGLAAIADDAADGGEEDEEV